MDPTGTGTAVVSREQLLAGGFVDAQSRTIVDTSGHYLPRTLGRDIIDPARGIEPVRGRGYRWGRGS